MLKVSRCLSSGRVGKDVTMNGNYTQELHCIEGRVCCGGYRAYKLSHKLITQKLLVSCLSHSFPLM